MRRVATQTIVAEPNNCRIENRPILSMAALYQRWAALLQIENVSAEKTPLGMPKRGGFDVNSGETWSAGDLRSSLWHGRETGHNATLTGHNANETGHNALVYAGF